VWELWDEIKTNSQAKVYGEFNLHKPKIIMVNESLEWCTIYIFSTIMILGNYPQYLGVNLKGCQFKIYR